MSVYAATFFQAILPAEYFIHRILRSGFANNPIQCTTRCVISPASWRRSSQQDLHETETDFRSWTRLVRISNSGKLRTLVILVIYIAELLDDVVSGLTHSFHMF